MNCFIGVWVVGPKLAQGEEGMMAVGEEMGPSGEWKRWGGGWVKRLAFYM